MKMKRIFAILSIVLLLFTQASPIGTMALESGQGDFVVEAGADATVESAEVRVISKASDSFDVIQVKLPSGAEYNQRLTEDLNQDEATISYDAKEHLLAIEWQEGVTQSVKFILENLPSMESDLGIEGFVEGEVVSNGKYKFLVDDVEVVEEVVKTEAESVGELKEEDAKEISEEVEAKEEVIEEVKEVRDENNQELTEEPKEEKTSEAESKKRVTNDEVSNRNSSSQTGDINADISISPIADSVLSGVDAHYQLALKFTGSKRVYKDMDVIVDLPVSEYVTFDSSQGGLEKLAIAGVAPTYDNETNQLKYHFDEIKRGQTYEKVITLETTNGYIQNGTELKVTANMSGEVHFTENDEAENAETAEVTQFEGVSEALVVVEASAEISIVKTTDPTPQRKNVYARGDDITWVIEVKALKKEYGQLYLKPGSKIKVEDYRPRNSEFGDMIEGPAPEISAPTDPNFPGNYATWEFDVPDFTEQASNEDSLFTKTLKVKTKVSNGAPEGDHTNNVDVEATFIDDVKLTDEASQVVSIAVGEPGAGFIEGSIYVPAHYGPANGTGTPSYDAKNQNPYPGRAGSTPIRDDGKLGFRFSVSPLHESLILVDDGKGGTKRVLRDFQLYWIQYTVDPKLNIDTLETPKGYHFRPNSLTEIKEFTEQPKMNIRAKLVGMDSPITLVEDALRGHIYTREELGLGPDDKVEYFGFNYGAAPAGMQGKKFFKLTFTVDKGATGEVKNEYNVHGVDGAGVPFNHSSKRPELYQPGGAKEIAGPRQAYISPWPKEPSPVGKVAVELTEHAKSAVTTGSNRMKVTLADVNNSSAPMNEQLETVTLLPPGVKLKADPNPSYTNAKGEVVTTGGNSYEVISDDHNGSGRQLVKIKWDESRLTPGQELTAELDVEITNNAPSRLVFDVYGFSNDIGLTAPTSEGKINDTVLQTDEDDLNGDGKTDHPRLKSGNVYYLKGDYDLQAEKLIKGPEDNEYSKFTTAKFEEKIDYKLKMTNTTSRDLSSMTLIDVLPTIGDLGITDNVSRGSKFTPKLTGPITIPEEWAGKVNVFYSTAQNPERDDLTRHTDYPDTTIPLTNPEGAEVPEWIAQENVSNWESIHSFKVELVEGDQWIKGQDIEIDFQMQIPKREELDESVKKCDLVPQQRAAWNSFAVATDHGQPVEPERVGVAIDCVIDIPVEKFWEGDENELENRPTSIEVNLLRNDVVIDTVEIKETDDWKYLFEGLEKTDRENNEYLYTIEEVAVDGYETNITGSPDFESGFIITNTLEKGSLEITKVDGKTGEIIPTGAEFELQDSEGIVVATAVTAEDGKYLFGNLPLGSYKLVETKAPTFIDGHGNEKAYNLLTKPIDIEIVERNQVMEVSIKNYKSGWELPDTAGIGAYLFYSIGILLMLTALFVITRMRRIN